MITSFEQLSKVPLPSEVESGNVDVKDSVSNTIPENSKEGLEPHSDDETIQPKVVPDDSDDNNDDSEGKEVVEDVKEDAVVEAAPTEADGGVVDTSTSVEVEGTASTAPAEPEAESVTSTPAETTEVKDTVSTDEEEKTPDSSAVPVDDTVADKLEEKNPKVTGVSANSDKTVTIEAPQAEENAGVDETSLESEEPANPATGTEDKSGKDSQLIQSLVESVAALTNKLEGFQNKVEGLVESTKLDIPAVDNDSTAVDTEPVDENATTEEDTDSTEVPARKSVDSAEQAPNEGTRPQTVPADITSDEDADEVEEEEESDTDSEQTDEEKRAAVEQALSNLDAQWPTLSPKLSDVERTNYLRALRHIRAGEGTAEDANIIESTHLAVQSREKETEEK